MSVTFGTWLFTKLHGEQVGEDQFGNRYFRQKKKPKQGRERRWVLYKDEREGSLVPPEWQGWLTHTAAQPPTVAPPISRPWLKPHQPNRTGTQAAYKPEGALDRENERAPATGDYEPWVPD